MKDKIRKRLVRLWKEWGKQIVIVLAIVIPLRSSIADWNDVPTGSMKPTILEGDRIYVNKLAYGLRIPLMKWFLVRWAEPQRGDIVVCFSPADGKRLVKRVIGLPGDEVAMQNNHLLVNGVQAQYGPLDPALAEVIPQPERSRCVFAEEQVGAMKHPVMFHRDIAARRSFKPVVVPKGNYLVLGDNRDISGDSRYFGFVPCRQIVGRVPAVVFSRDRDGGKLLRWDRWFQKLQ